MNLSRSVCALCTAFCMLALGVSSLGAAPVSNQGTWERTLKGRDLDGNTTTIEAYYDTVLDITWMADANLAFTSGFDADGRMAWVDANAWAAGLSVNGVSGWRLPTLSPVNGSSFDVNRSTDGTTDNGNAATTTTTEGTDGGWRDGSNNPVSEMGHMFYVTLGNLGRCDPALPWCTVRPEWGLTNSGPFSNIELSNYWSDTQWNSTTSWDFNINAGSQNLNFSVQNFFAWAVYDGDVGEAAGPVDLSGTIRTADGTDICAMVLASGKYMFSCNPIGDFSLSNLPRETNGTVKRQIYADGFFPKIDSLTDSSDDAVVMTRSGACPSYNTPYDPGFYPNSAGKRINISGKVLLQNSQTPICAMVLANGKYLFSCDGSGSYALNIPLDSNGRFKLQVYADGFAPTIQTFDEFQSTNDVRMARAVECQ